MTLEALIEDVRCNVRALHLAIHGGPLLRPAPHLIPHFAAEIDAATERLVNYTRTDAPEVQP